MARVTQEGIVIYWSKSNLRAMFSPCSDISIYRYLKWKLQSKAHCEEPCHGAPSSRTEEGAFHSHSMTSWSENQACSKRSEGCEDGCELGLPGCTTPFSWGYWAAPLPSAGSQLEGRCGCACPSFTSQGLTQLGSETGKP